MHSTNDLTLFVPMSSFNNLPLEVLDRIIWYADDLYEANGSLDIFQIMRVNRMLRDIPIDVHFNLVRYRVVHRQPRGRGVNLSGRTDDEKIALIRKMVKHEACHENHNRQRKCDAAGFVKYGNCRPKKVEVRCEEHPVRRSKRISARFSLHSVT